MIWTRVFVEQWRGMRKTVMNSRVYDSPETNEDSSLHAELYSKASWGSLLTSSGCSGDWSFDHALTLYHAF